MTADLQLLHDYAVTQDAEAFSAILREHQGLVYGTCLRILGNVADAEDAAQDCFLKLARHAATIRTSLAGWLHSCATNVALNVLQQRRSRAARENTYRQRRSAAGEPTWRDIAPLVDRAMEGLPAEVRYVVIERFLQQRSQTEIAEELGISRGVLRRRLESGIAMIRRNLKQAGVLASVAGLTGLMTENAAVAAPAALTYELGKIALAGVGNSALPPAFVGSSFHAAPTATLAVLAKKVAIALATAVLVAGVGIGVAWLCGAGPGGPYAISEEGGVSVSTEPPAPPGHHGAAAGAGAEGIAARRSGRAVAAGAEGGSSVPGVAARRQARRVRGGRRAASAGGAEPSAAAKAPQVVVKPQEDQRRKKRDSSGGGGKPVGRRSGPVWSSRGRPGVLYSIFGPATPSGNRKRQGSD